MTFSLTPIRVQPPLQAPSLKLVSAPPLPRPTGSVAAASETLPPQDPAAAVQSHRTYAFAQGDVTFGTPTRVASPAAYGGVAMGTHIRSNYSETLRTQGTAVLQTGTPAERLQSLDRVAQRDGSDDTMFDEERCGPSAIVAGVFYAEGREGLQNLIADMRAYGTTHGVGVNYDFMLGDLESRLRNNRPIRNGDLNNLQETLYTMMNSRQSETVNADGSYTGYGIHHSILTEFITGAPHVRAAFDAHDMALAFVDTDGQDGANHFILGFRHEGASTVYDPYPVNTGGHLDQVTQDRSTIDAYIHARQQVNGHNYVYNGGEH